MRSDRFVYTSAIVIIPPEEVWPPIQAIRVKYDEKVRRWMPHITLVYPFWPREKFADAANVLRMALCETRPFFLTLKEFNVFDHGGGKYTMWLAPEPAERLMRLHTTVLCALGIRAEEPSFRFPFRPHLSVGQLRGDGQRNSVLAKLVEQWKPLHFAVRDVALIWRNEPPDDVFRIAERIPFGQMQGTFEGCGG